MTVPRELRKKVEDIVERFNTRTSPGHRGYYRARFRGPFVYIDRCGHVMAERVCRLTYTGKTEDSMERAVKSCLEAYPQSTTEREGPAIVSRSADTDVSREGDETTSDAGEVTSCIGCGRDTRAGDGLCVRCRRGWRGFGEESRGRHSLPSHISGLLEDSEEQ